MTMVTGKNTQLKIRQTTGLRLMKRPNNIMPEGMPPSCTPPQQRIEKGIRQRNAIQYSNESEDEHAAKHKNADDNEIVLPLCFGHHGLTLHPVCTAAEGRTQVKIYQGCSKQAFGASQSFLIYSAIRQHNISPFSAVIMAVTQPPPQ